MAGLTLIGPDVPAWAPEGREGRSQEARRAFSSKSGPRGAPDNIIVYFAVDDAEEEAEEEAEEDATDGEEEGKGSSRRIRWAFKRNLTK